MAERATFYAINPEHYEQPPREQCYDTLEVAGGDALRVAADSVLRFVEAAHRNRFEYWQPAPGVFVCQPPLSKGAAEQAGRLLVSRRGQSVDVRYAHAVPQSLEPLAERHVAGRVRPI